MHRSIPALLSAAAIALPATEAVAAVGAAKAPAKKKVVTKKVTGTAARADRWGFVQVTIVIRKTTTTVGKKKTTTTRRITGVSATYPDHTDRSVFINHQALPLLYQEVLAAQLNPNIHLISGATDTSYAFAESLQAAILQAKKV